MHTYPQTVTDLNFVNYDGLPVDTSEQLDAFPGNGRVWTEVKQGNILNKLFWEGGGAPADVFLVTASAQVMILTLGHLLVISHEGDPPQDGFACGWDE